MQQGCDGFALQHHSVQGHLPHSQISLASELLHELAEQPHGSAYAGVQQIALQAPAWVSAKHSIYAVYC